MDDAAQSLADLLAKLKLCEQTIRTLSNQTPELYLRRAEVRAARLLEENNTLREQNAALLRATAYQYSPAVWRPGDK